MRPSTYQTRQDRMLRDCLASLRGRHATAAELCDALAGRGHVMGRTTVYRRLERLVAEGLVRKFVFGPGVASCYAWVGEGPDREESFHGYCEGCGAVMHLKCGEIEQMVRHLADAHSFQLDPAHTVFYGLCAGCGSRLAHSPEVARK